MQTVDGIPHCKASDLIICSAWPVLAPCANNLLFITAQYDESSHSHSVLRSSIKQHMHCFSRHEVRFRWKVHGRLEGRFGRGHVVQQLVHCPLLLGWHQLLVHLQLSRSGVLLIDQQLRLILHQVNKQHLQFRVHFVCYLQERA